MVKKEDIFVDEFFILFKKLNFETASKSVSFNFLWLSRYSSILSLILWYAWGPITRSIKGSLFSISSFSAWATHPATMTKGFFFNLNLFFTLPISWYTFSFALSLMWQVFSKKQFVSSRFSVFVNPIFFTVSIIRLVSYSFIWQPNVLANIFLFIFFIYFDTIKFQLVVN